MATQVQVLSGINSPQGVSLVGNLGGGLPCDSRELAWAKMALGQLSSREREILPLLAARWTDREIADALCISYRTVTTHVTHIFDKLGVNSRRAVAAYAQLVDVDHV